MSTWNKPLPYPTKISQPYWDALKKHEVHLQHCQDCGGWVFFPRAHCNHCGSTNLQWEKVSGEGELYTYTTARIPTMPEFTDEAPQQLAVVKLKEGVHINTNLIGVDADKIQIGMAVRPVFDERPGAQTILRFTAVDAAQASVIKAEAPEAEATPAPAAPVANAEISPGEAVFKKTCAMCHQSGMGGAPILGKKDDWVGRVEQGMDLLLKHATEGYTGQKGMMPPKGGNPALTDAEIKATVEFMVSKVK